MIVQNMWRVAFALFLSCHLAGLAAALLDTAVVLIGGFATRLMTAGADVFSPGLITGL